MSKYVVTNATTLEDHSVILTFMSDSNTVVGTLKGNSFLVLRTEKPVSRREVVKLHQSFLEQNSICSLTSCNL